MNTVIVHFATDGDMLYFVNGESVRLFIVDERSPHDRVYEWLPRDTQGVIDTIIPADAEIGNNQDDRHAALTHAVLAWIDGKPHLEVVK